MWKWVIVTICIMLLGSAGDCTEYDSVLQNAKDRAVAGDFTAAISLCNGVINQRLGAPTEPKALLLLGHILSKKQAPVSEMVGQFAQVADRFPTSPESPEALLRIGYLHERLKQPTTEWDRLVSDYPGSKESAEALHCLGHISLRNGDPDMAIDQFLRSAAVSAADRVCIEDSTSEAGYAYITKYWKTRKADSLSKAISTLAPLTRTSVTRSQAVRARLGRGEAFILLGLPVQASLEYDAALKICADDPYFSGIALFELGCCKYGSGSYDAALAKFDAFLSEVPGASLAEKDRQWKLMRPDYARTVVTDPEKAQGLTGVDLVPEVLYWKAKSLLKLGRASEASGLADNIAATFPVLRIGYRVRELQAACAAQEVER